jgi:predicted 2-oxoglutarate/Fe(II)-dependent dioxygenase YbiX
MVMKELADYIVVVPNLISDELCERIINEYAFGDEWLFTAIGDGRVDKSVRNVETIILSYEHVINANLNTRKAIDNELFVCAGNAIREYNKKFPLAKIEEDSGYELLRYKVGQFYKEHVDSFKARPRAVSCSFNLNDDYEGGDWCFWGGSHVVKVPKGSAVLFPSNFMYPHQITPVTKGVRYSIITWFI